MKRFRNTTKVYIPERKELLQTLHGGLLVLLLLSVSITFLTMVYSYKESKARYLYFLFTYGSAISNFLVGFVIFYYFCLKRKDLQKLLKVTCLGVKQKQQQRQQRKHNDGHGEEELENFVEHDSNARCDEAEEGEIFDTRDEGDACDGEEIAVGDALIDHKDEKDRIEMRGSEDEEAIKVHDKSVEPAGGHQHQLQTPFIQSEISENEHFSNAPNSIGECSLVSSGKRNKPALKPVELPTNLKNFVPENWRPARRRMNKGASYYPYYASENAPISASLAYSSKSSSLASTTVSGVPLYKNNHTPQHANGGIRPPVAFHSQQPHIPPNVQLRLAPPQPSYAAVIPGNNFHPPVINEIDTDPMGSETETGLVEEPEKTSLIESESGLIQESESEIDEKPEIAVAPNLYIPMPHVSIKQFILRNETSV